MQNEKALREASSLTAPEVYEVVRREGEEELDRPARSLVWSGVAAGMLMAFSVLGEAILRHHLPDTPWAYLVENLGYSFGFLLVILGRMQLFTENTITTILPLVHHRDRATLAAVARLWSIVFVANVAGAAASAAFMVFSGAVAPDLAATVAELSRHAVGFPPLEGFLRGVPAGVLVAAIVWMLPGTEGGEVAVILLFTWLIAAGDFTHIIAGSVEMWVLLLQGQIGIAQAFGAFFLPVLAGNIVGGTLVFTLLAWAQVKDEVDDPPAS